MTKLQVQFGKRIKMLRESKGLRQDAFVKFGINPSYLSALERGQKNATLEIVERIAEAMGVDVFQLFFFESSSELPTKAEVNRVITSLDSKKIRRLLDLLKILE